MKTINYNDDYQRIEQVKKFLGISQNTELATFFDQKNSQIFSEIKRGKFGISKKLAKIITDKVPAINQAWLLTGEGEMLRDGTTMVANNSDNTAAHINVATSGASIGDGERWLALYEAQQRERASLEDTLAVLVKKLVNMLPAKVIAAALCLSSCGKDSGCHWEVTLSDKYGVWMEWDGNPDNLPSNDSTLYCDGAPVVSRKWR